MEFFTTFIFNLSSDVILVKEHYVYMDGRMVPIHNVNSIQTMVTRIMATQKMVELFVSTSLVAIYKIKLAFI